MFRSVKSCVALFLLSAGAVFTSLAEAEQATLTGWFTFMVADYPSESGLPAETTYHLTEDSGERHELLIERDLMQPLGGPVAVDRERATVAGEWESDGAAAPEQFRVHSIHLDPPEEERRPLVEGYQALQATSETAVLSEAWVTILCRFADATEVTPHPLSFYEALTGSSYPGLGHYWNEVSYGNIDLAGSVAVGWYNLPRPRSYYLFINERGFERFETDRALADCTAAADADVFFPDFDGINLVFNHSVESGVSQAGGGLLTKDGQTRPFSVTWIHPFARASQKTIAHEMGHTWPLPHSSGPYERTYDSEWDVMSGGGYPSDDGALYLGVHTIAYHKDLLGWIPADRKYVARPNTTRTITLERLARPGAEGYLMAQIPIGESDTDFYTVEARLFAGYDVGIPGEAVIIHKVDSLLTERAAQVVDVDDNGDPNDAGAMWTLGETFTDLASGIQVSIDAEHATGFHVTIDYTICSEVLSPHQFLGWRGGNASVRVRAPSGCSWVARSESPWITITRGSGSGDGRVNYTVVEENPSLNARTGTLIVGGQTVTVVQAGVNGNLFEDDMESGADGWLGPSGPSWTLTTASSHSGTHAWTGREHGLYSPDIDLTGVESATLTFWHRLNSGAIGSVSVMMVDEWQSSPRIQEFTETRTQGWTQASLDLSPFTGQVIKIIFYVNHSDEDRTGSWSIDDVVVSSSDFDTPQPTQALLENPAPESSQSGVAAISGWACDANEIIIELNGVPYRAGYPTTRLDTLGRCGDTDNGFSLLWNWNNLGAGTHTVRALIDGQEFASTTVHVTTFGEDPFPRGWSGTFDLPDFPASGETTIVRWEESLQNFVITDGQPNTSGGHNRVAGIEAILENPSLGSAQSGVGVISGWACEAEEIVIELNGVPYRAGYPTTRPDTLGRCGDTDNGFSLLWNWNNLGAGTHTVRALIDGQEFANTTVRVTTFGEDPFPQGLSGTFPILDFPRPGENKRLRWEESLQNFVIIP